MLLYCRLYLLFQLTRKSHQFGMLWPPYPGISRTKLSSLDATVMVSYLQLYIPIASLISIIAWVMGAADPTSGTVSLHEVIRGLGALLRKGWKPLRTGTSRNAKTNDSKLGFNSCHRKLGCRRSECSPFCVSSPDSSAFPRSMVLWGALSGARTLHNGSRIMLLLTSMSMSRSQVLDGWS